MKTQNRNLAFNKSSIVELNDAQLLEVDGGTTPVCAWAAAAAVASSTSCAAVAAAAIGGAISYTVAAN